MIVIKFLILIFIILINQNFNKALADSERLSNLNCVKHNLKLEKDYLTIKIEDYKWVRNLNKALVESDKIFKLYNKKDNTKLHLKPILQKFKNWQKTEISYFYKKGTKCNGKGRIRLTGDFDDHIDQESYVASFALRIDDMSIYNNTRFKLFYPPSRNENNEIFINFFLKKLGFLAPDTRLVTVRFSKLGNHEMIMQEEINKEFLEKNNMTEGPIIEANEFLKLKYVDNENDLKKIIPYDVRFSLPKVKNSTWSLRSEENLFDTLLGIQKLNKVFFQNIIEHEDYYKSRYHIFPNYDLLSQSNVDKFNQLNCLNEILKLDHLSILSNRIFYFNPINQSIEPIIYDTDFKVILIKKDKNKTIIKSKCQKISLKQIKEKIINLNDQIFLSQIKKKGISKNYINKNYFFIKRKILDSHFSDFKKKNSDITINKNFIFEFYEVRKINNEIKKKYVFTNYKKDREFEICEKINLCQKQKLNKNDLKKLLEGKWIKNNAYFQLISLESSNLQKVFQDENLKIFKIGNFSKIDINKKKKIIDIHSTDKNARILFIDSKIQDYSINYKYEQIPNQIYKNQLTNLRGCLNFYNSEIDSINLKVKNCKLEDSVNLVSSNGLINNVQIYDSQHDALDIDFSKIELNNIKINNAGNDCLDLSFGDYFFSNAHLIKCFDKAISSGEKTKLNINYTLIKNSSLGLAVKDESVVTIEKKIDIVDTKECYAEYRKKQEFGKGNLYNKERINCNS